MRSKLTVPCN